MAESVTRSESDLLDRAAERLEAADLMFPRAGFYVIASVLAWRLFWELADHNQGNNNAQTLSWVVLCVALWLAENY